MDRDLANFNPMAGEEEPMNEDCRKSAEALDMAIEALEQTTWIPVSERLPEIKQHVLLSCYGRVVYGRLENETGNGGHPLFSICDSVGESRPIVLETTVHNEFTTGRITAWRPLPEPYKEDKKLS